MDFPELVKKRRSTRKYDPREIEREKIETILDCARLAPSAANFQPWYFYIITGEEARKGVFESYPRPWMSDAPVYIVACGDRDRSWKRDHDGKDYLYVDVAIAFEHLCLAAEEQGLGTCWVAHFEPTVLRRNLNLPDHLVPVALTPLGYPAAAKGSVTSRKPLSEITEWR